MRYPNTCASFALALALAAAPAFAQGPQQGEHHPAAASGAAMPMVMPGGQTPGAGGGMGMMGMMAGQNGMGGMRMMAEHVEGRIAFLKAELKITDAQLPLWNTFAQAMRESATAMQGMRGGMMATSQAATLPEKLDAREKLLVARLDAARKLKAAVEPLYAALSAEQKKTADEIMVGPMGMMM
jgi:LTXXQ motif family protein